MGNGGEAWLGILSNECAQVLSLTAKLQLHWSLFFAVFRDMTSVEIKSAGDAEPVQNVLIVVIGASAVLVYIVLSTGNYTYSKQ